MTATTTRRLRRSAACAALAAAALTAGPASAAHSAHAITVDELVVSKSGAAKQRDGLRARQVKVKIGRKRCAVASGTPLAALIRIKPGKLLIKDYGSCSRRTNDAGQLFVRGIGKDRNKGQNGWVYKDGRKLGTAGAGDPTGPFGRGRLRTGDRVTWFYCLITAGKCQSTLGLKLTALGGGAVRAKVTAYDDLGKGTAAAGAQVVGSGINQVTDATGVATFTAPAGSKLRLHATKQGLVRSFGERLQVR